MPLPGYDTERTEDTRDHKPLLGFQLSGILPSDAMSIALDGRPLILGRDKGCSVVLDRPRVSRRHVEFLRQGPVHVYRDLDSTNGTYVNGRRVRYGAVEPGALLRIGDWLGLFERVHRDATTAKRSRVPFTQIAPDLYGGARLAAAFAPLARAARSDLPVILVGPTGSGKELFARAVHGLSGSSGPLHAVNCAALPTALAEAELFGVSAGAFTGADRSRRGHLEAANGGTLFLDEALELPLAIQAKLLRVIEQREVTPLGETRARPFNARIVLACQRPLELAVADGTWRADLVSRVSGVIIRIPELSARVEDIPSLFHHFLTRYSGGDAPEVSARMYESLCAYAWPGGVRELEVLAKRLLVDLGEGQRLRRRDLPEALRPVTEEKVASVLAPVKPMGPGRRDHDRQRLADALKDNAGNVTLAARCIGISRQRAYRLMADAGTEISAEAFMEAVARDNERGA